MLVPASRASSALDFSLLSFLIVDDQPYSRRLTRSMLVGFGSREIYESANGVEAFELARNAVPNIIITDLVMPIFNGLRFIKMVKEPQSPTHTIPIIVLSGYLTKAAAVMVQDTGAEELLVKPVSPKALYEHIAHLVLRNDPANPLAFVRHQKRKKSGDLAYL
jgi:two-component system, chemotaxis family, chemotaxis protein CheY